MDFKVDNCNSRGSRGYGLVTVDMLKTYIYVYILVTHKCVLWPTVKFQMIFAAFHQSLHYLLRQK